MANVAGTPGNDNLVGTTGDDWIDGQGGDDVIAAGDGNDGLAGGTGNDELYGGAGDDWLNGGPGVDFLDGGSNGPFVDMADYGDSPTGVYVNLEEGEALDGWGGSDTLINIEGVNGSSSADILIGDSFGNWFRPGTGNDYVDAAGGSDVIFYEDLSDGGVILDLDAGTAQELDGLGNVVFTDTVLNFEAAHGSYFDDVITLTDGNNYTFTRGGDDEVYGLSGVDNIYGGSGNDYLDGGADYDIASYNDDGYDGAGFGGQGIVAHFGAVSTVIDNWGDTDTLVNIEAIRGSAMNDVMSADTDFVGYFGLYTEFQGMAGDDVISGNGTTRISYTSSPDGIFANFSSGDFTFTDPAATTIAANTVLDGWGGTDTIGSGIYSISGSYHDDYVLGSDGNDEFRVRAGDDWVDGGGGVDTIRYASASGSVHVNLTDGMTYNDGWGGVDTLFNIENIRGGNKDDTLIGDDGANYIRGEGGNDLLNAGTGDDVISGGSGNDTIIDAGAVVETGSGDDGHHHGGHGHGKGHDKHDDSDHGRHHGKGKGHDKKHDDDQGDNLGDNGHHHGKGHHKDKGKGHDKHRDDDGTIVVVQSDDDVYTGGTGDDLFVFGEYNGHDTIIDFSAGAGSDDRIDVTALNLGGLGDLLALADDNGGTADTTITFGDEGTVTLIGVQVADLHSDDFVI